MSLQRNRFHKTVKEAKRLSLSVEEKEKMRSSLLLHMETNPAISEVMWADTGAVSAFSYRDFFLDSRYAVPALILVLFSFTGISAFASRGALPGDILYPVKILSEKVESGLAISESAKERVETTHAVTRLEEAETLKVEGRLGAEAKAAVADSFNKDSEKAIERIGKLYSKDKKTGLAAYSMFKKKVAGHATVVEDIAGTTSDNFLKSFSAAAEIEKADNENQSEIENENEDSHDSTEEGDIKLDVKEEHSDEGESVENQIKPKVLFN